MGCTVDKGNVTKLDLIPRLNCGSTFRQARDVEDPTYELLWVGEKHGKCTPTVLLDWYVRRHQEGHGKMSGVLINEAHGAADANESNKTI